VPISVLLLAISMQGSFGSVVVKDAESVRTLLTTRGPSNVEMRLEPSSGRAQARVWRAEEEIDGKTLSFSMMSAMPEAMEENKKTIRDEINRRETEFEREGGRTMTIERGNFKVRLTARQGFDGSIVLHESSTAPVLYYRTIVAEAGMVDRAKSMLTDLTLMNSDGSLIQMYDRGFPSGWTYEFAGVRVKVPIPAQWEYLSGVEEADGFSGSIRYVTHDSKKESSWGMTERIPKSEDSILDLAKSPLPRSTDFSPNARILKADLVEWNGKMMLRQQGLYGNGEFEREWMSLTVRDDFWRLHTVFLKKDKDASWPTTPFPVLASGTPVVEGAWKKPLGTYERVVDFGGGAKFTYTVWGIPDAEPLNDVYTIASSTNEATTLKVREMATQAFKEWDMPSGVLSPAVLVAAKFRIVDLQWRKEGATWWLKTRFLSTGEKGEDIFRLIEVVGTEQGGEKFVFAQLGLDTEGYHRTFQAAVMSCKGGDGRPLFDAYPEGRAGSEYVLPYHKTRGHVQGLSMIPAISLNDGNVLLSGYILENDTRIFHSMELNKWGGVPHLQRVFEAIFRNQKHGGYSQVKFKSLAGAEINAERRNYKTTDGRDAFVTTFEFEDGIYTHVLQPKGLPENVWRKHVGVQ